MRAEFLVEFNAKQEKVQPEAEAHAAKWLAGQKIRKIIFVQNRLINFVV